MKQFLQNAGKIAAKVVNFLKQVWQVIRKVAAKVVGFFSKKRGQKTDPPAAS